jgi:hypothetical protein
MKEIRKVNSKELLISHNLIQDTKEKYIPFKKIIDSLILRIEGKKKEIESRLKTPPKKNKKDSAQATKNNEEAIQTAKKQLIELESEFELITSTCEEYQQYISAVAADNMLKERLGLNELKTKLVAQNKMIGANCATQGNRLENIMSISLFPHFSKALAEKFAISDCNQIAMLTNIGGKGQSIRFAASEFDGWLVEWQEQDISPRLVTRVLAIIEAKNNPNDIGRSFIHFQESLAFLTNSYEDFDQAKWKTKQFPKGDFTRPSKPILHFETLDKNMYQIAPNAFEHFTKQSLENCDDFISDQSVFKNASLYIDNIYFVTRRKWLNGFHSSKSSLFAKKLASNIDFEVDGAYDDMFREEVEQSNDTLSTAQVLRLIQKYIPNRPCQLVLVKSS